LYVHIPFCSAICNYCNFNRGLFDAGQKDRYVDALVAEILSAAPPATPEAADTIFFGGGTPSLLSANDVARIVSACRAAFDVTPDAEVTLEANPETVDVNLLRAFRTAGVNRLSFGVQSLRDEELKRHREHLEEEVSRRTGELVSANESLRVAKESRTSSLGRRRERVGTFCCTGQSSTVFSTKYATRRCKWSHSMSPRMVTAR